MAATYQGPTSGSLPANLTPCLGGTQISEIEQIPVTLGQLIQVKYYGQLRDPYFVRGSVWRTQVVHCSAVSEDGVNGSYNFTVDSAVTWNSNNGSQSLSIGDSIMFAGIQTLDQPTNQYYSSPNYTVVAESGASLKTNAPLVWVMMFLTLSSFVMTL